MKKLFFVCFLSIFLFAFTKTDAQEIEATVVINMDQIPQEYRISVNSLATDIERYLSSQKFTDIDWEGPKIPVDISIALAGGARNMYSAQIFIASKRHIAGTDGGQSIVLRLLDKTWSFEYNMGANHSYNPQRYDPFTTLLDFYMLLIIGFDLDTYGELDGTRAYEQAKLIATMAASYQADGWQTISQPGEFTRFNFINELTNMRYEDLRKLIASYYLDGLDYMNEDREAALENLAFVIQEMADYKRNKLVEQSIIFQAFFEAKSFELAETFKGYTKHPGVFRDLIYLDPSNTPVYEDAQKGK
ncbi:MAG: DUF4835 family protein [Candidatus Kapabacteria bacterium]|nr:DUF4835 family protein [Ignavibacteriota bacterium]MCW5883831.1 DUF4835 family protein [Candidatus Kapabacteria bacterium]